MTISAEDLYQLLPAVHRVRDADQGYPLRALVSVLAGEADVLAADIDGLYANWFIETCEDWVVPYLGDLLRVRRLHAAAAGSSERSYVANTLAYRRRKGTVSVVERLAYDVTGWRAKAVEEFHLLDATQNLNHLRPLCLRTPDLRATADLELLGGPFETATHAVEVRRIASTRGRYNIPDIAVMLWRLQAYPVTAATAHPVVDPSDGRYTFNPLGQDQPLYNPPRTETLIDHLAGEIDVPGRLRARVLHDELRANPLVLRYFAPGQEVLSVGRLAVPGATPQPVAVDTLSICDLSKWQRPTPGTVAVDVARGRLCFPTGDVPAGVSVSYAYGFSADVGAGPYSRMASLQSWLSSPPTWVAAVTQDTASRQGSPNPSRVMATLGEAVAAWNAFSSANPGTFGVICVADSCSYAESGLDVTVPAGGRLAIVAANVPALFHATPGMVFEPEGVMPHVRGDFRVTGSALPAGHAPGELILDGLLVQGGVAVLDGNLARLRLASATVTGSLTVATGGAAGQRNEQLRVEITNCLCGPIAIVGPIGGLQALNSVVDGGGGAALDAPTSDMNLVATTVFGATAARTLSASDCLFTGPLQIERLQAGCVRFSFVPDGSPVPRAFHCQPALALAKAPVSEAAAIKARLTPIFTSQTLGDPGYAQLARTTAPEILTGADNGAEMGVFNLLQQPQREANLRAALDEYLRFGLEAGIFFLS